MKSLGPNVWRAGAAALALLGLSCDRQPEGQVSSPEIVVIRVRNDLERRFQEMTRVDLAANGTDDFDEAGLWKRWSDFLVRFKQQDPGAHEKFMIQIKVILDKRKKLEADEDVENEMTFLDFNKLYERLNNRNTVVRADGTVQFPSKKDEQKLSLADLTPEEVILFEASRTTQAKMGIRTDKPFQCVRLKKNTTLKSGDKTVTVKAGDFVVQTVEGDWIRVYVHNGDRIMDSLSDPFEESDQLKSQAAPPDFEEALELRLTDFSKGKGRTLFHRHFPGYKRLITTDYRALLVREGISLEKHFVYFIQWAQENQLPPSEEAMQLFFENLLKQKQIEKQTKAVEEEKEKESPGFWRRTGDTIDQAWDSLMGRGDPEDHQLSYQDQQARATTEAAEVLRRNHGSLFGVIRLQGSFFDHYTYNRLTGNYNTRVWSKGLKGQEYLVMQDIALGLAKDTPRDIQKSAKPSSFAERLNTVTTYTRADDSELKKDLAFSESEEEGAASPQDFHVTYTPEGRIATITFKGKSYNPSLMLVHPERLRAILGGKVTLNVGGIPVIINLEDYFSHYRKLERDHAHLSQNAVLYDMQEGKTLQIRNVMWFVEEGGEPYKSVAERVTADASTPEEKLLALAQFVQREFEYMTEWGEVNKLTLATFMDKGGDCEDSFTTLKTLANAIGLGDRVGAVFFHEHVAPLLRGNFGPTRYKVEEEEWTIVETATPKGVVVRPGITDKKEPRFYMLSNGRTVSATGRFIPLELVPLNSLDENLVGQFNKAIADAEAFLNAPGNQPSFENLSRKDEVLKAFEELAEAIKIAYSAIAQTGKMADMINQKRSSLAKKAGQFGEQWGKLLEQERDNMRKLELKDAPEQFRASLQEYDKWDTVLFRNLKPAFDAIFAAIERYKHRPSTVAVFQQLEQEVVGVINDHQVYFALTVMQTQYQETLKYLPEAQRKIVEADLSKKEKLVQEFILDPYNEVIRVLKQLRRQ